MKQISRAAADSDIDPFPRTETDLLRGLKIKELSAKGQQYAINTAIIINGLGILYLGVERYG